MIAVTINRPLNCRQDQLRADRLLHSEIDFIPNEEFAGLFSDEMVGAPCDPEQSPSTLKLLADLPAHLARLCEADLLTATEEHALFRRMNYLKYYANSLRVQINRASPEPELLEEIEHCLEKSTKVRDRIIRANMRLVISVVKKFVNPRHSFDDLLSDGIVSLMAATNKFDYSRGFRFSTYAYRAISLNTYRHIADDQKENARYTTNSEDWALDAVDDRASSYINENTWESLRTQLGKFLHMLDRRERFIIRSRYALGSHRKVKTFQSLADTLGVSKERVRQLEQRAVKKLVAMADKIDLDEMLAPKTARRELSGDHRPKCELLVAAKSAR